MKNEPEYIWVQVAPGRQRLMRRDRLHKPDAPKASFHISSDYKGYDCPVTGKWIEGRAAHKENLKRTGCRLLEKGETRDAPKNQRAESERQTERLVNKMLENI